MNSLFMESINDVIDDAANPSVSSADDEENLNVPPLVKTDLPNIYSNMSSEVVSESSMEVNQSGVE